MWVDEPLHVARRKARARAWIGWREDWIGVRGGVDSDRCETSVVGVERETVNMSEVDECLLGARRVGDKFQDKRTQDGGLTDTGT